MTGTPPLGRLAPSALVDGGFGFVHSYTLGHGLRLVYDDGHAVGDHRRRCARRSRRRPGRRCHPAGHTVSGTTEADSLVRTTLRVQNTGSQPVDVGARTAMDVDLTDDEGPRFDGRRAASRWRAQSRIDCARLPHLHARGPRRRAPRRALPLDGGRHRGRHDGTRRARRRRVLPRGATPPLLPPLAEGRPAPSCPPTARSAGCGALTRRTPRTILPGKTLSFSVGGVADARRPVTTATAHARRSPAPRKAGRHAHARSAASGSRPR